MEFKSIKEVAFINPDSITKNYPYDDIEYIDIQSVGSGYLIETKQMLLSEAPSRAKRIVKSGDIILSTVRPNRRSFFYFKEAKSNTIVSTGFAVLRAKDNIDSKYLYYTIMDEKFTNYLTLNAKGAAYPAVDTEIIEKGKIPYFPIDIQQKIASILSAYDDLIENNTKRIKILEQMADAIYKEWFVKFRFPGYEKVRFVDSELGKIPEGWEVKTFLEVSHLRLINENILPYQGTKKYFATADVEGIDFIKDGIEYSYHNKPSRAQKQPVLNSVWFARMKDTYKVLLFSSPNLDLVDSIMLSSGFVGFEALSEKWLSFLFISIKSQEFHKQKDIFCTGATQMSLTNEGLARIKWLFPKENIIEEYDKLVRPIINSILVYQKQNKILRQTRDILLPKLISGELDVSDLEIKVRETDKEKV